MLHPLRAGDHAGVKHFRLGIFFEQVFILFEDAFHALAFLVFAVNIRIF